MKNDSILKSYIFNGQIYQTSDDFGFKDGVSTSIYEVIRVKKGVVLFVEDHLDRLVKSAQMLGFKMKKSKEDILSEIKELVKINEATNHNIKIVCSDLDLENQNTLIYITDGSYNIEDVPKDGAKAIIFKAERVNPNIKVVNTNQRDLINKELQKQNALEALLEDEEGNITEGSRSNMFFVKKDKLYTAPSKKVLLGITRSKIMSICKELNIDVVESDVHKSELDEVDGIFMSTTPIGILPIIRLDDRDLDSAQNKMIKDLMKAYEKLTEDYIKKHKS